MSYTVKAHRLINENHPVRYEPSPNGGGIINPRYLIIHYTAGTTADGAINWFLKKEANASAHLVIDRDGSTTQMKDFNIKAWHAGQSEWAQITGLNSHSIGIEIVNAGKLKETADGEWINWSGNKIPSHEVLIDTHKNERSSAGWQIFTNEQIKVVMEVSLCLHKQYNFLDVLGHDDISPNRKIDPGPAFPLISLQSKVLGRS